MEINRLRWASRRGMLELDLVLQPFLDNVYPGLDEQDQERFHILLDGEDQDLFRWFLGKESPDDPELRKIVDIIIENTGLRT